MSHEESSIPWKHRLVVQWQASKANLLNDFFWASANLACFFWLCGDGIAGYYGGVLTAVLLLMDVYLALDSYWSFCVDYEKNLARYQCDKLLINQTEMSLVLRLEKIKRLNDAATHCKLELDYRLFGLYVDVMYAISLWAAFSILCCFFIYPTVISVATALYFNVVGTVLCFTFNALFAAIRQALEVCKRIDASNIVFDKYTRLLGTPPEGDQSSIRKQWYFDLKLLASEWHYQQHVISYQEVKWLRAVLIDCMVPPVVFLALVFMPLMVGLFVLSGGLILAVASYYYIEKHYQHDMSCLPVYLPDEQLPPSPHIKHGFFRATTGYLQEKRVVCQPDWVFQDDQAMAIIVS